MQPFTYLIPATVEEAVALFGQHRETARYMAGGTDVIVKIKDGWMAPDYLINLKQIPGLDDLHKNEATGELTIDQRPDGAFDQRKRGAKFMRNVGKKAGFDLVDLL